MYKMYKIIVQNVQNSCTKCTKFLYKMYKFFFCPNDVSDNFRIMLGGRESNRTFLMGALFDGPYRAIAKTGLRPVLTKRPLTP